VRKAMPRRRKSSDRPSLSLDDQKALDDLVEAWDRHVQPFWAKASPLVRERFRAARM
jgi:hypothetical protein